MIEILFTFHLIRKLHRVSTSKDTCKLHVNSSHPTIYQHRLPGQQLISPIHSVPVNSFFFLVLTSALVHLRIVSLEAMPQDHRGQFFYPVVRTRVVDHVLQQLDPVLRLHQVAIFVRINLQQQKRVISHTFQFNSLALSVHLPPLPSLHPPWLSSLAPTRPSADTLAGGSIALI